ncbi:argininosuccinate lyase [Caldicellulosiruptoraceae bacterium PP1]
MKLWQGRFNKDSDSLFEEFNASIFFDINLIEDDINGSIAHVSMLAEKKIISETEKNLIIETLNNILKDFKNNLITFSYSDEDVHMFVEKELIKRIGDIGKKVHTARSRNDQVCLDIRLFCKRKNEEIQRLLNNLIKKIIEIAENNIDVIMPGFTHLQKAQPILFSHYILAYGQMFYRDLIRFKNNYDLIDFMPLGSAALAGTTYDIDRFFVSKMLSFSSVTENSIDTVSDRDFILEMLFNIAVIQMHLSRIAEEFIIWNMDELKYIDIDDAFCSGSSIMPQKKNPDALELIRGKTGRVYGNLVSLLTTLKALPLAYNKDMQEDKEPLFDSVETCINSLLIITKILETLKINKENMLKACSYGFINATDLADYLVQKCGIPFRDAHFIVGNIVKYCINNNKTLDSLALEEYKQFTDLIDIDVYNEISLECCINKRKSYGGTSKESVLVQLKNLKEKIEN